MKPNRRKLIRRSFVAVVTGSNVLAWKACGDSEPAASGNNSANQSGESSVTSDSDSQ